MKNRKTKPENLGLEGRLNPTFGFEKVRVTRVFGFGHTQVANPISKHRSSRASNTSMPKT